MNSWLHWVVIIGVAAMSALLTTLTAYYVTMSVVIWKARRDGRIGERKSAKVDNRDSGTLR